jgi:hypothetical protein
MEMEERPAICRLAVNILSTESRTADNGCSTSLALFDVLTIPHRKKYPLTNRLQRKPPELELKLGYNLNNGKRLEILYLEFWDPVQGRLIDSSRALENINLI